MATQLNRISSIYIGCGPSVDAGDETGAMLAGE